MVQQYTGTTSHQIPFFSILSAPIPIPHPRTSRRAPWLWCPSRPSPARHRRTSAASFLRLRSPLGSSSKHRSLAYRGTRESAALTSGSSGPSPGSSASSSGSTLRLQIFAGPTFASGPISSVTGRAIRRWKFFMAAAPRDRRRRGRAPGAASSAVAAEDDGEEHHLNPFLSDEAPSSSRVQFRNVASRARWVEEAGEAEVVDSKGKLWLTTGVTRGGKLYYNVEEIGFLAERGALVLLDDEGGTIGMEEIYRKIAGGNYGCSWDAFQAYRHLKLLGYIVGRYGVPWTMKHSHTCEVTDSPKYMADADRCSDRADGACNDITKLLREMRIDGIYPSFQVHLPNSKFKKSSPGDPSFLLCLLRDKPPSRDELETVESKFHGIPLKFCHVDNGRVSFLSFDNVVLPSLP